jgi:predicted ATPase
VLVIDDAGDGLGTSRLLAQLAAADPTPAAVGLVYAAPDGAGDMHGRGMPQLASVELTPWTTETVRVWLRTSLQGEPGAALVSWVSRRSGGLPARAERELQRLADQAALERGDDGGWNLVPTAAAGPSRARYRLPAPVTELIGREREVAEVARIVARRRLVTLAGPGGIGKTRLSLAVAAAVADGFADGAAFVPLEEATTPALVISAIARTLGVPEAPGQPLVETVGELLAERSALLVLDNFEQAIPAAPVVAQLLAAAPGLTVVATSREPLRLYGEQLYPVRPLPLPDLDRLPAGDAGVGRALVAFPALALFAARAQAASYDFALTAANLPVVAELCHRLDGLPLAIELAAARTGVISPEEMLAGIEHRLDLLAEGPQDMPDRQRTLRAAIDWSLALLDAEDRALFDRLGVFAAGCTLESAQAICTAEPAGASARGLSQSASRLARRLASLAEKNLLRAERDPDGSIRYSMLETIRSYAVERLDADRAEAATARVRHAGYYALLAERSGQALTGPDQATWVGRIERDYPNMRAALNSALDTGDAAAAARIAVGLWRYWRNGTAIGEGREWLDRILEAAGPLDDPLRAQALHAAALLAATQDDYATARALAGQSADLARTAGDVSTEAQAINVLGFAAMGSGEYTRARDWFSESLRLWSGQDDRLGMAIAFGNLAKVALCVGDVRTANDSAAASLELDRASGNTRGIVLGLECLSEIRLAQGDSAGARVLLQESLLLSRDLGDVFGEAVALHSLGLASQQDGDLVDAARHVTAALRLRLEVGDQEGLAASLETLATLAVDDQVLAARLLGATEALRDRHRLPVPAAFQPAREAALARIRDELRADEMAAVWTAGRAEPLAPLADELLALDPATYAVAPPRRHAADPPYPLAANG